MSEVDELAQSRKARYDQSGIRVLEDFSIMITSNLLTTRDAEGVLRVTLLLGSPAAPR